MKLAELDLSEQVGGRQAKSCFGSLKGIRFLIL